MPLEDFNVPIDPLGRYVHVSDESIWNIQRPHINVNFSGDYPEEPTGTRVRPAITGGQALWQACTKAGLFTWQIVGRPVIIEQYYVKNCTPTYLILMPTGLTRPMPTTVPFKLAAYESIQVTSTGAAGVAEVGFLVRLENATRA
jgi:hypothetical protein